MKKFILITALSLFFLAGCGSNNSEITTSDPEVLYKQSCLACHGSNLQGAAGPAVTNIASKFTAEEVKTLIMDGKGMMPGDTLTEGQADIVTEWLMEK